jgi:hypothetical protein
MTYYHPSRASAEEVARELHRDDPRVHQVKVEFEPDNGWVVVAIPRPLDLSDLADRFEIRHEGRRIFPPPASRKRWTPPERSSSPRASHSAALQPRDEIVVAAPGQVLVPPPWAVPAAAAPEPAGQAPAPAKKPWEV